MKPDNAKKYGTALKMFIARSRLSRDGFAVKAQLGKSTIDKFVIGQFTASVMAAIEANARVRFVEDASGNVTVIADKSLDLYGGYTRHDTERYIGNFYFVKPNFVGKQIIEVFLMEIVWDVSETALLLQEKSDGLTKRKGQLGHLFIPRASSQVFVMSNYDGWLKQLTLSQIDHQGRMKGVVSTVARFMGNNFAPVSAPILLYKVTPELPSLVGGLEPDDVGYEFYLTELENALADGYSNWVGLPRRKSVGKGGKDSGKSELTVSKAGKRRG